MNDLNPAYIKNVEKKKDKDGLFAKVDFAPGTIIYEFTGDFFSRANMYQDREEVIQIGKDLFMGPSGGLDDVVSHNCSPNGYLHTIGKRALLKSLNLIKAGMEITIDYSLTCTQTQEEWQMNCSCHQFRCRKIISGFQYLDEKLREQYEEMNIVPQYVKKVLKK
jgi:hypothetical protein